MKSRLSFDEVIYGEPEASTLRLRRVLAGGEERGKLGHPLLLQYIFKALWAF